MENELKDEELEKVTGGEGETSEMRILAVEFRDTIDGPIKRNTIGMVDATKGQSIAEEWCRTNNKVYVAYLFIDRVTTVYNTQQLLDSLDSGS